MLSSITKFQKTIWNQWNVRIVILFSLFLQIFLIVSAPSRKRTRSFFVSFVWLAYLLADWAAGYCIGLISNNQEQKSTLSQNDYLMAFWGPFLLLHLGGPDTISAFALEDNELWRRHLLALIFQLVTAAYVFLLTIPDNTLWLPTILMFVAGLIKYAERIHALYVAAVDNFRKSLLPDPDAGPNYAKLMEEHSSRHEAGLPAKIIVIPELRQGSPEVAQKVNNDQGSHEVALKNKDQGSHEVVQNVDNEKYLELVQKAFFFFHKFQGLIVDMIYSFKDRLDSQQYLKNKSAKAALMLIEIELNFMYEVFYTKAWVVREYWFWFWGKFISLISIMFAIILFIKEERHRNGFDKLDVRVTYALLSGALVLDVICLLLRFFSDYTATLFDESPRYSYAAPCYQKFQIKLFKYLNKRCLLCYLKLRKPTWSAIDEGPYKGYEKLSTNVFFRRWCGSISGYNLLKYCLDESVPRVVPDDIDGCFIFGNVIQRVYFRIVVSVQNFSYPGVKISGIKDLLDQWRYQSTNPFLKELWEYVFDQLKKKSEEAKDIEAIQRICSARGEWVIQKAKIEISKPNVDPNEVAALLESLKSNVDPNKVAALLESLKSNVDPNEVAALLESLKPNVDNNDVATLLESTLESLKPYVDPKEDEAKFVSLKPYMDANEATSQLESLKPNVDPNKVAALLKCFKPYMDYIIVVGTLESLKSYVDPNEVAFDESLLLWHIATSLCHDKSPTEEGHITREVSMLREISMLLSDYMLYLLIMQPNMMSAIAGMGQKRFQDTCEEAKKFFKKRIEAKWDRKDMLNEACDVVMKVPTEQKPIDVKGDRSKSLLFDACRLAKILEKLPNEDKKWEIIACVWVELLSYAACHCRPTGHVQLLSKGGELISFVWLLMVQLGLGTQFQIKDGDARAKLIVGKLLNQSTKKADIFKLGSTL
ncbi:hypothetical protein QN277_010619 [Acacia crassicarpa]|uniref:DUF4220 domain-containing protein n=1 Tax=Acacia crassicarpa TaxID=499986 RepID=A0AAE1IM19_9FABA|nr:hypothetical protein QN277_010619 [Acacia crassicarpa]